MSFSGSSSDMPSSDGRYYDSVEITNENEPVRVVPSGIDTGSIVIKVLGTAGYIYLGWDEEVSSDDGFPLETGDAIVLDIDNEAQAVWAVSGNVGDEIRVMATN